MLSEKLSEAVGSVPQPVIVRRADQSVAPGRVANAPGKSRVWRRAGAMATAGILFGFSAAVCLKSTSAPVQKAQRWVQADSGNFQQIYPSGTPAEHTSEEQFTGGTTAKNNADVAEVERLKTRTRRLEALVQVLRKRAQVEKRDSGPTVKN